MINKLKAWWYKRKARAAYVAYKNITAGYSRSQFLMVGDSVKANEYAQKFNEAMRKLKSLGEKVPDAKL